MQLRAKHWGLQVKWWKKVERRNSAHLCFKKLQCEWLSQPSGSFLFVPPCLCPKTHLDAPYTFSSFISSISWFGHLNLREIYHTPEAVFLEEGMNDLCLLLQHVSCKIHSRVPKSWSMLFPMNCTNQFGDHQQQTAKLHTKKTSLQQAPYSGESFIFTMQQFHETKLSTTTLIQISDSLFNSSDLHHRTLWF